MRDFLILNSDMDYFKDYSLQSMKVQKRYELIQCLHLNYQVNWIGLVTLKRRKESTIKFITIQLMQDLCVG